MGKKFEKALARLLSEPSDYTYNEASTLLKHLGYMELTKGKTSGSRVQFYRESDQRCILLHKPHPSNIMDKGAVKDLKNFLIDAEEI